MHAPSVRQSVYQLLHDSDREFRQNRWPRFFSAIGKKHPPVEEGKCNTRLFEMFERAVYLCAIVLPEVGV
jgi:hypothetical protein